MHRTSGDNAVCNKNLEQALAEYTKAHGRIDVMCGGWPCQNNSIAGNRKGHAGEKSGLWKEYRRLIELFLPRWVVAENVPGLFSVNNGKDFWHVISDLDSLGYCVAWRVLDSRYFGVAQRRRRVFIVGSFGNIGAGEVLFEQESGNGNHKTDSEARTVGLCFSTRDGERQDPNSENIICAKPIMASDEKLRAIQSDGGNIISHTLGTSKRGTAGRIWDETNIAALNTEREREASGISYELVSPRGVVIGNAVTVNVAEWIGRRIVEYEQGNRP